jgi:hypothetical protein
MKSHRGCANQDVLESNGLKCSEHAHDFVSVHAVSIARQRVCVTFVEPVAAFQITMVGDIDY